MGDLRVWRELTTTTTGWRRPHRSPGRRDRRGAWYAEQHAPRWRQLRSRRRRLLYATAACSSGRDLHERSLHGVWWRGRRPAVPAASVERASPARAAMPTAYARPAAARTSHAAISTPARAAAAAKTQAAAIACASARARPARRTTTRSATRAAAVRAARAVQACCTGNGGGGGGGFGNTQCTAGSVRCTGTTCAACGGAGQPCCNNTESGLACGSGLACNGATCAACGGAGQTCCTGDTCGARPRLHARHLRDLRRRRPSLLLGQQLQRRSGMHARPPVRRLRRRGPSLLHRRVLHGRGPHLRRRSLRAVRHPRHPLLRRRHLHDRHVQPPISHLPLRLIASRGDASPERLRAQRKTTPSNQTMSDSRRGDRRTVKVIARRPGAGTATPELLRIGWWSSQRRRRRTDRQRQIMRPKGSLSRGAVRSRFPVEPPPWSAS